MRIRWRGVARVAAVVLVGLIALRLLPGLMRAPEPPPLAADVGLPRAKAVTEEPPRRGTTRATGHRAGERATEVPARRAARPAAARVRRAGGQRHPRRSRARPAGDAPASIAVIGSSHRPRRHSPRQRHHARLARTVAAPPARPEPTAEAAVSSPESGPPPVPEYAPPPPPEASPEPAPGPSTTPGDGSEEFAPH